MLPANPRANQVAVVAGREFIFRNNKWEWRYGVGEEWSTPQGPAISPYGSQRSLAHFKETAADAGIPELAINVNGHWREAMGAVTKRQDINIVNTQGGALATEIEGYRAVESHFTYENINAGNKLYIVFYDGHELNGDLIDTRAHRTQTDGNVASVERNWRKDQFIHCGDWKDGAQVGIRVRLEGNDSQLHKNCVIEARGIQSDGVERFQVNCIEMFGGPNIISYRITGEGQGKMSAFGSTYAYR